MKGPPMSGSLRQTVFVAALLCVATVAAAAADTRLSVAAMNGDMTAFQSLLNEKVDVNAPQGDGSTALHWAAYRDDLAMARLLLQAVAQTEVKTRLGDLTPLYMAAKNGNYAIIELL